MGLIHQIWFTQKPSVGGNNFQMTFCELTLNILKGSAGCRKSHTENQMLKIMCQKSRVEKMLFFP